MFQRQSGSTPELVILLTFLGLIVFGTVLLKLDFVSHTAGLGWVDALFLATSAVCVTGLATLPVSGFNTAGQLVLLLLVQLGALGIMTLSSSLLLLFRGQLSLGQRVSAAQSTATLSLREVEDILRMIIKFTFISELVGFVVLATGFFLDGFPLQEALFQGLFHTISAFCNAGFSPLDSSMTGAHPLIRLGVLGQVILGGIGYYVVFDLGRKLKNPATRLTLHTKMALVATSILVFGGALLIFFLESWSMSPLDALFQSVTTRTAGFNSVDLQALHYTTIAVMLVFMVIGAAPGSTGGGVKITTFTLTLLAITHIIRGRSRIVLFKREIPFADILRAFAVIFLYLAVALVGFLLLLATDGKPFLDTLFEIISAIGTVGLSLGITGTLTPPGKFVIVAMMFVGRIGPALMMAVFLRGGGESHLQYPEEKIILG